MECNLKKQSVCVRENRLNQAVKVDFENEFILPDYCPPIKKVLNCKIEPEVSSKSITSESIGIDGIASVRILYVDEYDELYTFDNAFAFNKSVSVSCTAEKYIIKLSIADIKSICEVKAPRKIIVKGDFDTNISFTELLQKEFVCADQAEGLEALGDRCLMEESVLLAEKNVIIDEEIELSDSHPKIARIINYYGKINPEESKIMSGKIMLRGTLTVHTSYLAAETGEAVHIEQKIPYSQVCDMDGLDDGYTAKTSERLIFLEVKCRTNGYDDGRTLTVNAKLCINTEAVKTVECSAMVDAYSTLSDIKIEEGVFEKIKYFETVNSVFSAKKGLEFSEGSIGSVIDICPLAKITGLRCNNSTLSVFGIAYIRLILCTLEGIYEFYEKAIDFEYKCDLKNSYSVYSIEAIADIIKCNYIITSDSGLDIICELAVKAEICEKEVLTLIGNIETLKNEDIVHECSVNLCYYSSTVKIWNIAKEHKCSLSDIYDINGIDRGVKEAEGMLLIPVK